MAILHIGAPKTGSTSIQSFLYKNKKLLEESGVCYPDIGLTQGGHVDFRGSLTLKSMSDPHFSKIRADFQRIISTTNDLLICSEFLWQVHPENLVEVYPSLSRAKIIFYIRNQVEMMESHYKQKVKGGASIDFPEKFIRDNIEHYNYDRKYEDWCAALGKNNIHPVIYEDAKVTGLIEHFCSQIFHLCENREPADGSRHNLLRKAREVNSKAANESFSAQTTNAILAINRCVEDIETRKEIITKLRKDKQLHHYLHTEESLFSDDLKEFIKNNFRESNQSLAHKLGKTELFHSNPAWPAKLPIQRLGSQWRALINTRVGVTFSKLFSL
ncbi:hypothetical protein [Pseudovibrio sp. Tun.PSC04-5.I4]|uniref:hypothetical protein n=1 Tax=Pseudovibrio sp. Tun.PSC04-5.I4 TaxID=1798213 RepID=UPI0008908BF5|nr:hypothetical protein [Pseudovibrio sp. Tun.PSC04-5.I4]SDR45368.1 hypothetical protein SAMN04515695_5552 [Pseudovibrio sp. Tun.PSC04-5.I4]